MVAFTCGFCESDADIYLQIPSFIEYRSCFLRCGDVAMLEERLKFRLIGEEVAREEGCERAFGKEHNLCALSGSLTQKVKESMQCGFATGIAMHCTNLGGSYANVAGHVIQTGFRGV
jgi:hypothetical protein